MSPTGLPAPVLVDVARSAIAAAVEAGDPGSASARAHVLAGLEQRRLLQPVINATGVLLHTNMGRAPLAVQRPAGYTNLELDLGRGNAAIGRPTPAGSWPKQAAPKPPWSSTTGRRRFSWFSPP